VTARIYIEERVKNKSAHQKICTCTFRTQLRHKVDELITDKNALQQEDESDKQDEFIVENVKCKDTVIAVETWV
jgi:hypothetical protein